jgi:hypothetical protein
MSDIALDSSGLDIDTNNGSGLSLVEDADAIAQSLLIRLRFFQGEYFLDTRLGIPYFEKILIKNPNLVVVRQLYRETILETPGVLEITRFDLIFTTSTRMLKLDFTCLVTTSEEPLDFSTEFLIG